MRLEENAFRNKFDWHSLKLQNRRLKTDFKNFANLWPLEMSVFNSKPYKSLTSSRPFPVIRSQAPPPVRVLFIRKIYGKILCPAKHNLTAPYLRPVGTALAFDGRRLFRYKSSTLFAKLVFLPSLSGLTPNWPQGGGDFSFLCYHIHPPEVTLDGVVGVGRGRNNTK